MEITIVSKTRIYPSVDDARAMNDTMHTYTAACNFTSDWVFKHQILNQSKINKALYYEVRDRFNLGAQLTQSVFKTVISKYKTIHAKVTKDKEWTIKPVFKKHGLDLVYVRNYSIKKNDTISISTLKGRVVMPFTCNGVADIRAKNLKLGTAKLIYKHKKWFIHVPITIEIPDTELEDIANIVGIDLGINFLATTYNSAGKTEFFDGRAIKQKRAYYKELRASLQRRGTRSARKRLGAIGSRENRWMSDVNHCVSKALVEQVQAPTLFVLEDLTGIRGRTEQVRRKDRYTQVSWAFYQLRKFIEYKATMHGHQVIAVNPRNTSRMCPKCGHVHKNNRNSSKHLFKCKACGYTSNDDRVAAMNLHNKGIQYRVQSTLCTP